LKLFVVAGRSKRRVALPHPAWKPADSALATAQENGTDYV